MIPRTNEKRRTKHVLNTICPYSKRYWNEIHRWNKQSMLFKTNSIKYPLLIFNFDICSITQALVTREHDNARAQDLLVEKEIVKNTRFKNWKDMSTLLHTSAVVRMVKAKIILNLEDVQWAQKITPRAVDHRQKSEEKESLKKKNMF